MNKPIYQEIHFIRAVACLLVVMVHVTGNIYNTEEGFPNSFSLILNQFSRLGTPIFAALSAFLLFSSVKNRGFNLKKFILSRTTKIIFPFIIWSIVYIAYSKLFLGWEFPNSVSVFLFTNFILGDAFFHLYFISTIIQFYCIFPFLQFIRNRFTILILFFISLPLNYLFLEMSNSVLLDKIGALAYVVGHKSFVLNWISYFLFGATLAYYYHEILKFFKRNIKISVGLCFLVIVGISLEINPNVIFGSSRPANLIYIPMLILFLQSIYGYATKYKTMQSTINLVGKYSMGIYLIHPLVITIIDKLLPEYFWATYMFIFTYVLTLAITVSLVKVILLLPLSNYIISVPLSNTKTIKKDINSTKRVSAL